MAIEYEIDITSNGNELNIDTTANELNVESQELELTLSRTGAQGPPGESSDIFFSNTSNLTPGSNPDTQPSEWSQDYDEGTLVFYMAIRPHDEAAWEVVGFPSSLQPGIAKVATDPTNPAEGEVWFNTTDDELKYYDGTNTQIVQIDIDATLVLDTATPNTIEIAPYSNNGGAAVREGAALIVQTEDGIEISAGSSPHTHTGPEQLFNDFKIGLNKSVVILPYDEAVEYITGDLVYFDDGGEDIYRRIGSHPTTGVLPTTTADWTRITVDNGNDVLYNSSPAITAKANRTDVSILRWEQGISFPIDQWVLFSDKIYRNNSGAAKSGQVIPSADPDWVEVEFGGEVDLPIYNSSGEVEATPSRLVFTGDGVTVITDSNDAVTIDIPGGTSIAAYDVNDAPYALDALVYNSANGIIYRSRSANNSNALTNPTFWQSLGGATQIAPATVTAENLTSIGIPNDTTGAQFRLSSNNNADGLSPTPNRDLDIFGTGGITVTAHGTQDVVQIDGSGIAPDINILDLETVFSFTDSALSQDLVGYVTSILHGIATVAPISDGNYEISGHTLTIGNYYIFTWNNSYAIGVATTTSLFATVETHLASGDALPTLNQSVEIVNLVNVQRQELPVENQLDIISNSQAISLINQEIGKSYEQVDEGAVPLRIALSSATNAQGGQSNPANINGEDPEYVFGAGHVLIWYVTLTANDEATTADQRAALELAVLNRREFAVTPSGTITDANLNDSDVYHFTLTTLHDFGDDAAGNETFQVRAVLVDPTRNDAFRTAFGFVGPDPLHYPDRYHFATQNVIFDHIQVLETQIVVNIGQDTELRDTPATVADSDAWTAYINTLGVTGDVISGTQFPAVTDHTPGDLFMLTAGHTQPADDDLIYVGLYVLVENAGNLADEWIHLTEYKTTEVELNYPGGSENVTFYGNKGVEDLAQDLLDTTALVYNNMNLALGLKQDTIDADNAEDIRGVLNVADGADVTPANGIYLETATAADQAIPKWNATSSQWELGTDTGGGSLTIQEDGTPLTTAATTLNFVGQGVTATGNGATKTITIPGGTGITQFGSVTQWLNSLTAPTGSTLVVDDQQVVYTPSGGSAITITFVEFIHPVGSPIDQDVDAILSASGYGNADEFYLVGTDRLYYVATTGNHLHLSVIPIDLGDLSDVVITEVADGEVLQWNDSNSRWENAAAGGISNNFRYALLLTNGFLLPENSAMSTDDRDAYTDTLGVYGAANTVYWFDNTNDGWFNVATGGTALISFPS